jgi:glycosyltransferase involved in cell wall biosynthesis
VARKLRVRTADSELQSGVNLVGYARGVLGMGEHVRMSGRAMVAADIPCGVVDFDLGIGDRKQSHDQLVPTLRSNGFNCNIFHINADQMARTYWHLGGEFFSGRRNIGYWAWELSKWPEIWRPTIGFVDEIWAPSRFVQNALAAETDKPVVRMPLCIDLKPPLDSNRLDFGVEAEDYLFVFTFDCHSYIERKNPLAAIRAFRKAFPPGLRARLIIKAMNASVCTTEWDALAAEGAQDDRITLIDERWPRKRLLELLACCDCYVSLHRSEGFGRSPAEAMLLGKPVIATNYSGTTDFCRPDNSLLVDYDLVELAAASYVCGDGQVWAEPSIDGAARHMAALFYDRDMGKRIGAAGQQTIASEFSARAVGHQYRGRLIELGVI